MTDEPKQDPAAAFALNVRQRVALPCHELVEGTPEWEYTADFSRRRADEYALRCFATVADATRATQLVFTEQRGPVVLADALEHVVRFLLPPAGIDRYRRKTAAVLVEIAARDWPRRLLIFEAEDPARAKPTHAERPRYPKPPGDERRKETQVYRRTR